MNGTPRYTKKRQAVTELLRASLQPLSAANIVEKLHSFMDQATVYRSLQYLETNGVIESFIFECGREGILKYYTFSGETHRHYFHCEKCHRFMAVEICETGKIRKIEKENSIRITSHTVCYRGICDRCN